MKSQENPKITDVKQAVEIVVKLENTEQKRCLAVLESGCHFPLQDILKVTGSFDGKLLEIGLMENKLMFELKLM